MNAPAGEPPRIVAFVPDLMDRSKVASAAVGRVTFVTRVEDLATAVETDGTDETDETDETGRSRAATLVVVDLSRPGVVEVLPLLAAFEPRPIVIGFGSHVDREQLADARRAGADRVLARSAFFADLATLLA